MQEIIERLEKAHKLLLEQQMAVRQKDSEEPPLSQSGDLVLLPNVRRRKGENPKLQPKFFGFLQSSNSIKQSYIFVRTNRSKYKMNAD